MANNPYGGLAAIRVDFIETPERTIEIRISLMYKEQMYASSYKVDRRELENGDYVPKVAEAVGTVVAQLIADMFGKAFRETIPAPAVSPPPGASPYASIGRRAGKTSSMLGLLRDAVKSGLVSQKEFDDIITEISWAIGDPPDSGDVVNASVVKFLEKNKEEIREALIAKTPGADAYPGRPKGIKIDDKATQALVRETEARRMREATDPYVQELRRVVTRRLRKAYAAKDISRQESIDYQSFALGALYRDDVLEARDRYFDRFRGKSSFGRLNDDMLRRIEVAFWKAQIEGAETLENGAEEGPDRSVEKEGSSKNVRTEAELLSEWARKRTMDIFPSQKG